MNLTTRWRRIRLCCMRCAAQVEVAILQSQRFGGLIAVVVHRERRRFRGVENLDRFGDHFDLAALQVRIRQAGRSDAHGAVNVSTNSVRALLAAS